METIQKREITVWNLALRRTDIGDGWVFTQVSTDGRSGEVVERRIPDVDPPDLLDKLPMIYRKYIETTVLPQMATLLGTNSETLLASLQSGDSIEIIRKTRATSS
jgi:hypothetical protein